MLCGVMVNTAKKLIERHTENASVAGNFHLGAQKLTWEGQIGGQKEPSMKAWGQHVK